MSDTTKGKAKAEPQRRPVWQGIWIYLLAYLPAGHVYDSVKNEYDLSARSVWALTGSWIIVWAVTILIVIALNRIWTNLRWHHRPFTVKDQKYCVRAGNAALIGSGLLILYSLVVSFFTERGDDVYRTADMVSTQTISLLTAGAILHVLAEVHRRGARYFEELEKGV